MAWQQVVITTHEGWFTQAVRPLAPCVGKNFRGNESLGTICLLAVGEPAPLVVSAARRAFRGLAVPFARKLWRELRPPAMGAMPKTEYPLMLGLF